jgi:hypothetical protein
LFRDEDELLVDSEGILALVEFFERGMGEACRSFA